MCFFLLASSQLSVSGCELLACGSPLRDQLTQMWTLGACCYNDIVREVGVTLRWTTAAPLDVCDSHGVDQPPPPPFPEVVFPALPCPADAHQQVPGLDSAAAGDHISLCRETSLCFQTRHALPFLSRRLAATPAHSD
ncbi:hypothetical protein AAFF_G00230230 [Aldrovandia affinis]|uniref:Secreted protein n=1 Tax=Aldrovandia affinis TaxID=143900 RepID=A0AAD7SVK7_9TELE|nr:hypothetical protein AAFF_G00230230 [Aldrovandia affinis]